MPCSCGKADCNCIKPSKKRGFRLTSTVCRICKLPTPANVLTNEGTSTRAEGKFCTCFMPSTSSSEVTGLSASTSTMPKVDSQTSAAEMPVRNIAESEKDSWEREHSNSSDLYAESSGGSRETIDRWRDVVLKETEKSLSSSTSEEGAATPGRGKTVHIDIIRSESATESELRNTGEVLYVEPTEVSESAGQRDESANNNRQVNEPNSRALSTEIQADPNQQVHQVAQQQFVDWQLRATTLAVQSLDPRSIRYFRPPIIPQPQPQPREIVHFAPHVPFYSVENLPGPSNRPRQSYYFPPQNILPNPQLRQNHPVLKGSSAGGRDRLQSIRKVKDWIETLDSSPDNSNVIQPISDREDNRQVGAIRDSDVMPSVSDQDELQARGTEEALDRGPTVSRKLSSSTTDESSNNAGPAEQRRYSRPRRKVAKKETDQFNKKKE